MKSKGELEEPCTEEDLNAEKNTSRTNILPLFWELASLEENKRVECVIDLISALKEKKTVKESDDNLEYTLKRLVKGLSSSRKGARQGYATALTQLLINFDEIDVERVFDLMKENLVTKGSFKSQEARDVYFGQAFCYAAIYQAIFQRGEIKEKTFSHISVTVDALLTLMRRKSFLQELCSKLIADILEKADKECFEKAILPLLDATLKKGWKTCTAEDLLMLLAIERLHKESVGESFFKTHWGHTSICDKENFDKLGHVLMNSTASVHPRMHIVWKEIIGNVAKSTKILKAFWNQVIEETLMKSTHERKYLALKVLQEVLSIVKKAQVEIIFSSRIMKSIFNCCTSEKNFLYTAVKNLLTSMPLEAAKNPNSGIAIAVVHQLTGRYGNFQFDQITKSKTVESLVGQMDAESAKEFALWLQNIFVSGKDANAESQEESDEDKVRQRRKWAINQLLAITRNINAKKEEKLLQDVAKFLFFHGFFHVLKRKKSEPLLFTILDPPIDDNIVNMCKERFLGVLGELSTIHPALEGESQAASIVGTKIQGDFFVYHVIKFAEELLEDSKHVTLNKAWTPEAHEIFRNVLNVIENIRSKVPRNAGMSESRAFELLFLHTSVQMFDKTDEATEVAEELLECYKKISEKKKKQKDGDEEPHWSEVLTEILLSYLAQSSHLMRQVVNLVFSMILPHITPTGLQLIIEALRPKKNTADGDLEMVDESEEEEMEIVDEEAEPNQNENIDAEDHDEESSDGSDDGSDDENEIDEAFKTEIKAALGDAALPEESEEESDDDEASDIDMDQVDPKLLDSMDKALAAAFKARLQSKSGKKKKHDEKRAILHFRLRVLDVAETFVKKQSKSPLILEMIEPLLEVIKSSAMHKEERALHDRTLGLFKNKICHAKELPCGIEANKEDLHLQIEHLIVSARNASSVEMVNLITQACMFLIRVLRGKENIKEPSPLKTRSQRKRKKQEMELNSAETTNFSIGSLDTSRIVKIFTDALSEFMLKRNSHLQPVLFLELIKRYPAVAWKMATEFPVFLSEAVNNFRKGQACEMILQLLTRQNADLDNDFLKLIPPLQKQLIHAFNETCDDQCTMKAKHIHELVKLADRFIKRGSENEELSSKMDVERLAHSLEKAMNGPIICRSPKLVAYCKSLVSKLKGAKQNGHISSKKSRKTDSEDQDREDKQSHSKSKQNDTEGEPMNVPKMRKKKKHKE